MKNSIKGAAIVEYVVGLGVVAIALFLPVLPEAGGDGTTSAALMLIDAMRHSYASYLWGMSLPV